MNLNDVRVMLAQGVGQTTQQDPRAGTIMMVAWAAVMMAMVYFVMIRPQQKRSKELNSLMGSLKPGDKVVTASGIVGVIVSINEKEKSIALRSADAKMEILKSSVAEVKKRSGEPTEA